VSYPRVNNLLLAAIIVVNLYIIATPFVPGVIFWLESGHSPKVQQLQQAIRSGSQPDAQQNRLIVPHMLLDQPINEGSDIHAANNGPWRLPFGSTPDRGGNTVIVGHRFTYTNPRGVFYHLDQLHPGDEIGIYWRAKKYLYKVTKTAVVPPTTVSVEAPTANAQLTLYTCTPLWWPKDRLVITATLESSL
jgi:LPXTG-site transpeptidase (sortase) family protein